MAFPLLSQGIVSPAELWQVCQSQATQSGFTVIREIKIPSATKNETPSIPKYDLIIMLVSPREAVYAEVACRRNRGETNVRILPAPVSYLGIKAACEHRGTTLGLTAIDVGETRNVADGFESSVRVRRNNQADSFSCLYTKQGEVSVYSAQSLRSVLFAGEWALVDTPHIRIKFNSDQRLAGNAGCNNYFGAFSLRGNDLRVSQLASTKKACAPDLMTRESGFLQSLANAHRLRWDGRFLFIDVKGSAPSLKLRRI